MSTRKDTTATPDAAQTTSRIADLVARSQKVWAATLERNAGDPGSASADPLHTMPALTKLAQDTIDHPQKLAEATLDYWTRQADLWTGIVQKSLGGKDLGPDLGPDLTPEKGDKRFKHEAWDQNPVFDYLKQSYLLTGDWLKQRLADAEGLSPAERRKLEFLTRNLIEAIAPTNYAATNPEVLQATLDEGGDNPLRGLDTPRPHLELAKGRPRDRPTPP